MKQKNTSRRTDGRGGVAKYAAYVLSGKRFSAPEAANETKLRYSVTQYPSPPLRLSIPAATVSQVKSRGFLPRICKLYKSVRVEAQAAASYSYICSYIASSSFAFLVFGGIFEMLLAAFLATMRVAKNISREYILFFLAYIAYFAARHADLMASVCRCIKICSFSVAKKREEHKESQR